MEIDPPVDSASRDNVVSMPFTVFERMEEYKHVLADRLKRAVGALEAAGIAYAVIGGIAVGSWVSQIEEGAARQTEDVDILLNRCDLERAKIALASVGFVYRNAASIDMFLDGPKGSPRQAIHIIFSGEKVRQEYLDDTPLLTDVARSSKNYSVVSLPALVRMKLTSYRMKDRLHLQDLLGVGLLDETWMEKVPEALRARMREVLDDPPDELH